MAKGRIVKRRPKGGDKPKTDKKGHLVFRGYAAESRWLSRTSGNRSQMAWSG
jgi:hypothetical protein